MKKNVAVGQVTFTHSSTIAEFNSAFKKALKELPEIKMQPNCPFVTSSKTHFITNGEQNLRIDFEKQGATINLRIIAESIGEANIEKDKVIILRIFEQLCKTCEELPYPKGKDGKVRRVKLTCEKDYRIEESWYESEPDSFGANLRFFKEYICSSKKNLLIFVGSLFLIVSSIVSLCSRFSGESGSSVKQEGYKMVLSKLYSPSTAVLIEYCAPDDIMREAVHRAGIPLKGNQCAAMYDIEGTNRIGGRERATYIVFFQNNKAIFSCNAEDVTKRNSSEIRMHLEKRGWKF